MAQLNFNATNVEPDAGTPVPVPAGVYNVMVDESDVKPTANGSGAYLQVRYNILDGQYAGRKLFDRFNIQNQNPVAQEIGYKQLSALAHAVNVLHIQDSAQLHGIPLQVKVKIRAASGDYEASNEVSGRFAAGTHATGSTGSAPVAGGSPFGQQAPAQAQGMPAGWGQPAAQAAPAAQPWAQQGQQAAPVQQAPVQQQAPAQPWAQQQAPVEQPAQQPVQQPWGQPAAQQAPVQQPVQQAAPVQQPWANGTVEQAPAQAQQAIQQAQNQAPIVGQPAAHQLQPGQTAQQATPPWATA